MLISRSFIDVLFILLLGTLVLLSQSVRLGALDTSVVRLGGGGISPVSADDVQVVLVGEHELRYEQRPFADVAALAAGLAAADPVLLVTADEAVRHHRVLRVWSALRSRGLDVKLGAAPGPDRED